MVSLHSTTSIFLIAWFVISCPVHIGGLQNSSRKLLGVSIEVEAQHGRILRRESGQRSNVGDNGMADMWSAGEARKIAKAEADSTNTQASPIALAPERAASTDVHIQHRQHTQNAAMEAALLQMMSPGPVAMPIVSKSVPGNMTTENTGIAWFSVLLVNLSQEFWIGVCVCGMVLIVTFLSRVNLEEKREDLNIYQVLPFAVVWCGLGICLVLFNKILFLQKDVGFEFPYTTFLIWMQALAGTLSLNVLRFSRPDMMPAVAECKLSLKSYSRNIIPIAGLQAAGLALGSCAYLHISVAYIQMVKSTTSAFVFIFSIFLGMETATTQTTAAVGLVLLGLFFTSAGELQFSMLGFMLQMGGTLSDSLRISLTKIVLSSQHAVNLDPLSAMYYGSPTTMLILTAPMVFIDLPHLTWLKLWSMKYVLFSNVLLAFGLNVTAVVFMKRCGATTLALTGVIKDVALILVCFAFFGHPLTIVQLLGFLMSLVGVHLYNQLKSDNEYVRQFWLRMRGIDLGYPKQSAGQTSNDTMSAGVRAIKF